MNSLFYEQVQHQIDELHNQGLYKSERCIASAQQASIMVATPDSSGNQPAASSQVQQVINLCANNYLGLANHPEVVDAACRALNDYGFGMGSVRFICGTLTIHKELERQLSAFLGMEDTILYASCFDANGGFFETILDQQDAVISDTLNHASIIDGIRLCKAKRYRYANNDMSDLEQQLIEADKNGARYKWIVTDGVFSMDGVIANLSAICDLADKYQALVMVDDSHAVGFLGANGRGTHEYCHAMGRVDVITGTLGKALGGAAGGYTSAKKEIVSLLRQRSRPYLFSNTLAPPIVGASLKVLELIQKSNDKRNTLLTNAEYFRQQLTEADFSLAGKDHPIIPVMLGDAKLAAKMAEDLLAEGVYVIAFSFPVVPKDQARIRVQVSASHTREQLDYAVSAFCNIGRRYGVIA